MFKILLLNILLISAVSLNAFAKETKIASYVYDPVFDSNVYIEEYGKNNPVSVILIHGLGDNGLKDWSKLIPLLEKDYHILAFDLPGFGRSQKKNNWYSPKLYSTFIKSLADCYIKGPYIVMGHSLGGAIALFYTATFPKDIEKLVLIDVAGILHRSALSKFYSRNYLNKTIPSVLSKPLKILEDLADSTIDYMQKAPVEFDLILGSKASRNAIFGGQTHGIAGLSLIDTDYSHIMKLVKIPTMILWGEKDTITSHRVGKVLNHLIPNSQLNVIKGAGHTPMLEIPDETNRYIIDFVKEKESFKQKEPGKEKKADKAFSCINQTNKIISGSFTTVTVKNSDKIILKDVSAEKIVIINSSINIENSFIDSPSSAMDAKNSKIVITSSDINGLNIFKSFNSSFDIAGVKMQGTESAFTTDYNSVFIFSVCEISSPKINGYMHGPLKKYVKIKQENSGANNFII